MIKKFFAFFLIHIKLVLKELPSILLGTVIFAACAAILCYGFMTFEESHEGYAARRSSIGIVSEDTSSYTFLAISYLSSMDGIKDICSFTIMEEAEAASALKSGRLDAVLYLPQGFLASVLDGSNIPAHILLNRSGANSQSALVRAFVDAGADDLAAAQGAIYSMDYAARQIGLTDSVRTQINTDMNYMLFHFFAERAKLFSSENIYSTGQLSPAEFYICSGIVLFLMLSGISCVTVLKRPAACLEAILQRERLFLLTIPFFQVLCISCFYSLLLFTAFCVSRHTFHFSALITVFSLVFLAFSVNIFLLRLCQDETTGMLLIFILTVITLFLTGGFIPEAFLPKMLLRIGNILPAGILLQTCEGLFTGFSGTMVCKCTAYAFLFVLLSIPCDRMRPHH
jgi:ABC-2 type transport system permease protein